MSKTVYGENFPNNFDYNLWAPHSQLMFKHKSEAKWVRDCFFWLFSLQGLVQHVDADLC